MNVTHPNPAVLAGGAVQDEINSPAAALSDSKRKAKKAINFLFGAFLVLVAVLCAVNFVKDSYLYGFGPAQQDKKFLSQTPLYVIHEKTTSEGHLLRVFNAHQEQRHVLVDRNYQYCVKTGVPFPQEQHYNN